MPEVVFQRYERPGQVRWLCCREPLEIVQARRPEEVLPALAGVQQAVERGLCAAGFLAYEAAAGLDDHFDVHCCGALPLVWFGLFRGMEELDSSPRPSAGEFSVGDWQPSVSQGEYQRAIARVKEYIAAGDTYQVNYTFRLRAGFRGDAWAFFHRLCRAQRARHCAYVDTGEHVICSASPELFFGLSGGVLTSRPMKGTAPRGLTFRDDRELALSLAASVKNRAENAMIVDMMRNDMGRIAQVGSVTVSDVFRVEKYPTLFQMTSTVAARTAAPFVDIVRALFPCASITGAPKIRTMQIIRQLEPDPRGVYTGCIGYLAPGGEAQFNVAIRTLAISRRDGLAEYGVGGGVVWDSQNAEEYAECLTKAAVLTAEAPDFELLETLLWEPPAGFFLLDGHLRRLSESAQYFDFAVDAGQVRAQLAELAAEFSGSPRRVRLRVDAAGRITLEHAPLSPVATPYRLRLARSPVNPQDAFLYHKTTNRRVYEAARNARPDCDDDVLWNPRREVTETTIANIVVEKDGVRHTPPVACGLLPGVFRAHLLETGQVREKTITIDDLVCADRIFAANSVRVWMPAALLGD